MEGLTVAFIIAMMESLSLLFLSVFYIVTLSDLDANFINAMSCCDRLNKVVIPEVTALSLVTILYLCFGCYGMLALSLPMTLFLIYRIVRKPLNHISYYDPGEILNRNQLTGYLHEAVVKLVYHLISFFMVLFCTVNHLIGDEINLDAPPHRPML